MKWEGVFSRSVDPVLRAVVFKAPRSIDPIQVQERESDIHADAVIVSRAQPSDPRHGRIPAEPAAILPSKIIVPLIVMRGLIFEQFASAGVRIGL